MSARDASELKGLQVRLSKARGELDSIKQEGQSVARRQSECQRLINDLEGQIKALTAKEPVVTEHAMLRYLERVRGVDLEQLREEMMLGRYETIKFMRSGNLNLPSGHKMIIKDCAVVTVE